MKRSTLFFAAFLLLIGTFLSACKSQEVDTEDQIDQEAVAMEEERKALEDDIEDFKMKTTDKIEDFNKEIDEIRADQEAAKLKKDIQEKRNERIAQLEQKIQDLKEKMNNYKLEGKENWEQFKEDYDREMEELRMELKELKDRK